MKFTDILPLLLLISGLSACSDADFPGDVIEDPVFRVNSSLLYRTAGVNDTYLFTKMETDSGNVLVFSGTFADVDCPAGDCPNSMAFIFRHPDPDSSIVPDSIFKVDQPWMYRDPFGSSMRRITIRWVNTEGDAYRSDLMFQSSDAYFNILESEPWENNENGEKTWKMTVEFSCRLSQPSDTVNLEGIAVIAVAYP